MNNGNTNTNSISANAADDNHPNWHSLAGPLLSWYRAHARHLPWRETKDPYRIWVSEIMLQQTRVEAVRGYYARFMEELPDVASLAACPDDRLMKLWEGLGYYSRARNLKKAAITIMESHDGRLPADHAALLKLPGIGPYTAGAIASIAFGLPVPAVDGNVLRVRARVFGDDNDIADQKLKNRVEEELSRFLQSSSTIDDSENCNSRSCPAPGTFNQALMDLGAMVCLPNGTPQCEACPWQSMCVALKEDRLAELPVKKKKAPRRIEKHTIFLIMDGERVVLQKRPAKGLLAGLYELPNVMGHLNKKEAIAFVRNLSASADSDPKDASDTDSSGNAGNIGLQPLRIQKLAPAKHIFTHIEWHMTGYLIRVDSLTSESSGLLFAEQKDIKEHYSIPSAFDAYIGHIKDNPLMQ